MKNKLIVLGLALFLIGWNSRPVLGQTDAPPDFPINDSELVDPDASDFSSDIFSEDFGTDGTDDATDTTDTTDTTEATDTTETVTTTTVADTTTGPRENAVFWISFLAMLLILQTTRQLVRDKQHDVF